MDLAAVSFAGEVEGTEVLRPLEDEDENASDHGLVVYKCKLQHFHDFTWIRFKTRKVTDEAERRQEEMMGEVKWDEEITEDMDLNRRVAAFHAVLIDIRDQCFPAQRKEV